MERGKIENTITFCATSCILVDRTTEALETKGVILFMIPTQKLLRVISELLLHAECEDDDFRTRKMPFAETLPYRCLDQK
ncbi:hypothetical protein KIN20_026536 [Parelaphostrongylus tenuis]|uniref:Uncharacterized protein n=1 Tax=Parelaphostrongylus tenuis TaxID=148309 RepID=A0AAD5QY73_PARTN|nr:hypothetical protein KIN20_026536 [Parelaphostrongylus tenuis]